MHPTLSFIKEAFSRFNRTIFREPLPEIGIRLVNAGSCVGKFSFPRRMSASDPASLGFCRLSFSRNFDLAREAWEDVVIHEMLHFAIWYGGHRDTGPHGQLFRKLMNDINRIHGRHITVRHKSAPGTDTADRRMRRHFVCVTRWNDGRQLISVMTESYAVRLRSDLRRVRDLRSARWFFSTDPYFNKYPHVRTLKFFKIPEPDIPRLNTLLTNEIFK